MTVTKLDYGLIGLGAGIAAIGLYFYTQQKEKISTLSEEFQYNKSNDYNMPTITNFRGETFKGGSRRRARKHYKKHSRKHR
jgi:hypothetical protein